MRRKRRPSPFLIPFFIGTILLGVFVWFTNPSIPWTISGLSFSPIILFFVLLIITLFSACTVLFKKKRRGLLVSLYLSAMLLLKLLGYTNPMYYVLLTGIVILLESALSSPKFQGRVPKTATPHLEK